MALKKIDFRKRSFSNCGMRKIAYCEGVPKCSSLSLMVDELDGRAYPTVSFGTSERPFVKVEFSGLK